MKKSNIVEITPQQRKFCELIILYDGEWTATQCAIEAGYSEKSARVIASQLQNREKYPKVYDYLLELREEQHKKYHVKALLQRSLLIYVGKRATDLGEKGLKLAPDLGHDRNMVRGSLCAARQNTPKIRQTVRLYID
jgi:phage terminase small subunit